MRPVLKALIIALALLATAPSSAPRPRPTPVAQACHYEQLIEGDYTTRDGYILHAPIGRIEITTCSSPTDLAQKVEQATAQVRAMATAQAATR